MQYKNIVGLLKRNIHFIRVNMFIQVVIEHEM